MLFEKVYDVNNIFGDTDFSLFKEFCEDWNLNYEDSPSGHWFVYGFKYGLLHNLDPVSSKCMGDVLAYYMTGIKLDNSSSFFRVDSIIDDLDEIIYESYDFDDADEVNVKKLLVDICELFSEVYDNYTYKKEQVLLRISFPLKHRFKNVRGETYSEKLFNLISHYENSRHF